MLKTYIRDLKSVFPHDKVVMCLLPKESSDFNFCSKIKQTQSLILRGEHTSTPNNCVNLLQFKIITLFVLIKIKSKNLYQGNYDLKTYIQGLCPFSKF